MYINVNLFYKKNKNFINKFLTFFEKKKFNNVRVINWPKNSNCSLDSKLQECFKKTFDLVALTFSERCDFYIKISAYRFAWVLIKVNLWYYMLAVWSRLSSYNDVINRMLSRLFWFPLWQTSNIEMFSKM